MQGDNGSEFLGETVDMLSEDWPTCKILKRRARQPQTQGSVESSNKQVEKVIAANMAEDKAATEAKGEVYHPTWALQLKHVQYQRNSTVHSHR